LTFFYIYLFIYTEEVYSYSLPRWLQAKVSKKRERKYFVDIAFCYIRHSIATL